MRYRLVLPRCFVSTGWSWWCDSSHREDPSGTGSDPMVQKSYSKTTKEEQKLDFKTDYRLILVVVKNAPFCRPKALQNTPRGAFCNTFDLH